MFRQKLARSADKLSIADWYKVRESNLVAREAGERTEMNNSERQENRLARSRDSLKKILMKTMKDETIE